jgi:hypothetical protein
MNTTVVHCKNDPFDVYIGRPGIWGNPFDEGTRSEKIRKYKEWIVTQDNLMGQLSMLRGKRLGCWCKPKACHGDVLVDLLTNIDKDVKLKTFWRNKK